MTENCTRGIKGRMQASRGPFLIRVWKPCLPFSNHQILCLLDPRASAPSTLPPDQPLPQTRLHNCTCSVPFSRPLTVSSLPKHKDQTLNCDPITSCRCSKLRPNRSAAHLPLNTPHVFLTHGFSSRAVSLGAFSPCVSSLLADILLVLQDHANPSPSQLPHPCTLHPRTHRAWAGSGEHPTRGVEDRTESRL